MDFAWSSDPLLVYALGLSAGLFLGIFLLILTIILKHGGRLNSEKIQKRFATLIHDANGRSLKNESIQVDIDRINALIAKQKKDVAYGWVRLLEQTAKQDRGQYIAIAMKTNMLQCIPHCLNDEGIAEKCIALEAIGLSGFDHFLSDVQKYVYRSGIAPYSCVALARLIGIEALPQIIQSHEKGALSNTQALSAILEIPMETIVQYCQAPTQIAMPKLFHRYLGIS